MCLEPEFKLLILAIDIAIAAHKNQVDKGGHAYINHCFRVMDKMNSITAKQVAVLHDVLEDTEVKVDDLKAHGFSKDVIEAIETLTKNKFESRKAYIEKIKNNRLARLVKIEDLTDNMNFNRIKNPTEKDFARVKKYHKEKQFLLS